MATQIANELVAHATRVNNFVRVDMEGSPYTQKTLDIVYDLHGRPGNAGHVGAVIQAYLRRSEQDVRELCAKGIASGCARAHTKKQRTSPGRRSRKWTGTSSR